MTWKKFLGAVYSTMRNTGMIFIIITGAMIFNVFLAITKIPILLATAIGGSVLPPTVILSFMIIIYLVLGCFIDAYAMVMLTIPIFYPVALELGYDPIFFGILIVLVVEMAMITPPVGMNVFAISGITEGVPLQVIFRGALPFVGVMIFFIIMIIAFPNIVLFLPDYFGM
jgi:TRAP-type C4-dicarboxylate transport system permease large subunit